MPRHRETRKDAATCDKPGRGGCSHRPPDLRMGKPDALCASPDPVEGQEATRGTETSKYPEEKKANAIPSVVASESGEAQTGPSPGFRAGIRRWEESERKRLESLPGEGEGPVRSRNPRRRYQSKAGHVESCPKVRGPSRKAEYSSVTDSEQVP